MNILVKDLLKRFINGLGYDVTSLRQKEILLENMTDVDYLFSSICSTTTLSSNIKSQLGQDIFVLAQSRYKQGGFFVEFGATNGVDLSNTHLLEAEYQWSGVLVEPARVWHESLQSNRECTIDHRCVWVRSKKNVKFKAVLQPEYSGISNSLAADRHQCKREFGEEYFVETVSLEDLLREHNAPKIIDYLSIDTEGSELEILHSFNFSAYQINIVTVEHNFTKDRLEIFKYLTGIGYRRVLTNISKWDDWYILEDVY